MKGPGNGKTPERIVSLLREEVEKSSQSAVARNTVLPLYTIQRCLKGIGEPTTATLQKLADYFGVTVAWLRGEEADHIKSQPVSLTVCNMERRELALKLLDIQHKVDQFWDKLQAMGLDPSESAINSVDALGIVVELYGFKSLDDDDGLRQEWSRLRVKKSGPREMLRILEQQASGGD